MTASILKQDPNTKRFNRTLIYYDTDTQYTHFRGNPHRQATKRHLLETTAKRLKTIGNEKETDLFWGLICCRL